MDKHTYLPGVPIPLYPEEWLTRGAAQELKNEPVTFSLPILPIDSVFLFPGFTLPMRIRQKTWTDYLTQAIADSRKVLGSQVRIGIVTLMRDQSFSHGLIGKVGTFATITCTHESDSDAPTDTADTDNRTNRRHSIAEREIIVTMVGTGRFRVIDKKNDVVSPGLPMYTVVNLDDDRCFTLPQETKYRSFHSCPSQGVKILSNISSVPSVAYKYLWPWTLVEIIVKELLQTPALVGFRSLPPSSGFCGPKDADPEGFSFWLASNLPMCEEDRLALLGDYSTVERLLFIRNLLRSPEPIDFIRCVYCNSMIAKVSDIFTMNGANGCNGAYVNSHGFIHQTWTVRQVLESGTFTVGQPETKDSWFPGFSWTCCSCTSCYNHLGWKFTKVSNSANGAEESIDDGRPTVFYGMSGVNIYMKAASKR